MEKIAAFMALADLTVATAQSAAKAVSKLKPMIDDLFDSGEITAEKQAELRAWVDAESEKVRDGVYPEHMQVAPDPGA